MALFSAKPWVGISSYNSWFVFSAQNTIGDWDFRILLVKFSIFGTEKNLYILHGQVFVMSVMSVHNYIDRNRTNQHV